MFTVICYDEQMETLLKEYEDLCRPFIKSGQICFCRWVKSGMSINEALPELYDLVGEKKEWNLLLVNHSMAEAGKNPYDVFSEKTSIEETEKDPIIRLTHMLSEITPEFDMELVDEEVLQPDLYGEEDGDSELYLYRPRRKIRCVKKTTERDSHAIPYNLECERPTQIYLLTSRKWKEGGTYFGKREEHPYLRLESDFWSRNEYPRNVRYFVFDIHQKGNQMNVQDLFSFIHGILLLALNEFGSSSVEAYSLYRVSVVIDKELMGQLFSQIRRQLQIIHEQIGKEYRELSQERKGPEAESIPRFDSLYAIEFPHSKLNRVSVDTSGYSYAKDRPRLDEDVWHENHDRVLDTFSQIGKEISRSVETSLKRLHGQEADSCTKPVGSYSEYQLEDIRQRMDELEAEMFRSGIAGCVDLNKEKEALNQKDKTIRLFMDGRLARKQIVIGIGIAYLVFLAGFFPMLFQTVLDLEAFLQTLLVTVVSSLLFLLSGAVIIWLRKRKLLHLLREYDAELDRIKGSLEANRKKIQDYVTKAFNYRDAWNFVKRVMENRRKQELSVFPEQRRLMCHRAEADRLDGFCKKIMLLHSIPYEEKKLHVAGNYSFRRMPDETDYYVIPVIDKEKQPAESSYNEKKNHGFEYVSGLRLEKEDTYD